VKDFGAVADGKTDSAAAVQQALDAATKAGGGRVVVPAAKLPYLVEKTVFVRSSNIEILGQGAKLKLADNAVKGSHTHVLHVTGTRKQSIANVVIRGLTIDANFWNQRARENDRRWSPRGLLVTHARAVLIENVQVERAWVSLSFAEGAEDAEARNTTVRRWHNDGFDAANGACNIRFVRCRAHDAMNQRAGGLPGSRDGAWEIEDGVKQVTLTDCLVEGTDGEAFTVRSHNTTTVNQDIRFVRCKVSGPARVAFQILGRDHDTRTEQVFLEDCRTSGLLECSRGADLVKVEGGEFGRVGLIGPRRVEIIGSTIGQIEIDAREQSDGKATFRPSITLQSVKLAEPAKILGDARAVRILKGPK